MEERGLIRQFDNPEGSGQCENGEVGCANYRLKLPPISSLLRHDSLVTPTQLLCNSYAASTYLRGCCRRMVSNKAVLC